MTTSTYSQMLDDYLFGPPSGDGYWRRFKERCWRLCGSYAYRGKRDEVLARRKARTRKRKLRWMVEEMMRPSVWGKLLKKDESVFQGIYLPVPVRFGEKLENIAP